MATLIFTAAVMQSGTTRLCAKQPRNGLPWRGLLGQVRWMGIDHPRKKPRSSPPALPSETLFISLPSPFRLPLLLTPRCSSPPQGPYKQSLDPTLPVPGCPPCLYLSPLACLQPSPPRVLPTHAETLDDASMPANLQTLLPMGSTGLALASQPSSSDALPVQSRDGRHLREER